MTSQQQQRGDVGIGARSSQQQAMLVLHCTGDGRRSDCSEARARSMILIYILFCAA